MAQVREVAQRRVLTRRANGDRKQPRLPTGVGCHDSLSIVVSSIKRLLLKPVSARNSTERGTNRRVEKRNNGRVIIAERVDLVDGEIVGRIGILLRLVSSEKPPTAIYVLVRLLTIHVTNRCAVHGDAIGRETASHVRNE